MAVTYPIYLNLLPTKLMNGKGSGKKSVDDAAVAEFDKTLVDLVHKAQVSVKDPKNKNKETIVQKYETDINKISPKPTTGFSLSCTIIEIFINVVGNLSKVGVKVSGVLSDWHAGTKGTGELAGGFLTGGAKGEESGTSEQRQASLAGFIAKSVAEDFFKKLEGAIKAKLSP